MLGQLGAAAQPERQPAASETSKQYKVYMEHMHLLPLLFELTRKKTPDIFCDLQIFTDCTSLQLEDRGL